jgi:hypothetical protein
MGKKTIEITKKKKFFLCYYLCLEAKLLFLELYENKWKQEREEEE